ncbi:hypothetical protein HN51_042988 [Arachis hypogaea]|uniref:Replication factor A C-terminal domain-containing protein n=1 Tax=Arachis hypogaea TaxID=3818 RepID=A0A444Y7P2_ARAHY|nr:uncharacterized protein LOC107612811 [Arachis ipaensis]XP_025671819.1 uncharacterized protein LOC112771325 [Arachis hypogaea]RYQ97949.1 hypothetical protein Ahy_B08g094021 isoform A [Arachis hypogaea]
MEAAAEQGERGSRTQMLTGTVLGIDHTDLFYRVCALCERTLSFPSGDDSDVPASSLCKFCHPHPASASSASKRLFRILMSVATETKVFSVICFDRVARVLFGCSADDFFHFAKLHPFCGVTVNEILEGEMFTMTLTKPLNGNARHLRLASAVPLSSTFQPIIQVLREYYTSSRTSS